jgi:hypothetical protein
MNEGLMLVKSTSNSIDMGTMHASCSVAHTNKPFSSQLRVHEAIYPKFEYAALMS